MKKKAAEILEDLTNVLDRLEGLGFDEKIEMLDKLTAYRGVFEMAPGYRELDRRYNLAIEGANDGIFDWDVATNHVVYSDRWARVLGYDSADELEPSLETWRTHVHPDDYEMAIGPVNDHINGKTEIMPEAVYRMYKKDGSIIYTAHRGKAHFDETGKAIRMVGTTRDVNEEITLRNRLLDQNRFVNSILNHSPQLIFVKDSYGRFLKVNQSVANLFGKSIEELESLNNADVHDNREELDAYDSVEKEVLKTRKSISVEEKFTNSKGEQRTFYTVKTPLVRPSGEVDILGISNDITELRESQISLLRQEREYRGILESLRVVVGTLDQFMRFNYFNPALVSYLKFTKLEHILHLPVSKIIHKEDFDVFKANFQEVLNHKARLREGRIRITKGKEIFWFNYALTDRGRAGDKKEVLISLYDISEQVQFSRELQRSERIFRAIAVNSADIIGLHGPLGHLKYVSPAAETLLGYTQEELLGRQAFNLVHPDDRQRIRSLVVGVKDVPHVNRFVQIRVKSKQDEYLWMEITLSFIESDSGEPPTIQTASRDITERKKIEEERKRNMDREAELNEFQRSFVMMSSHQFRTPLTVIKSDVDLLRLMYEDESAFDKNRMIRIADRMKTSVSRMTYLMEDILTLGKLDAGAIEKHITTVELLESLDELIQNQFTPLATGRMLVIEFETDEIQIETDLDLLSQAIANFITNADKYSEGEKAPVLTVRKEPGFAIVEIKDFGIGIPKSDIAKLYHPFFRGSNAKDYRGTGLGLRIAKNFLDMIDAEVSIDSVENEGTTVVIKIPTA